MMIKPQYNIKISEPTTKKYYDIDNVTILIYYGDEVKDQYAEKCETPVVEVVSEFFCCSRGLALWMTLLHVLPTHRVVDRGI